MTTASETTKLFSLPPELILHILTFCHPTDIARFAEVCRSTFDLVCNGNSQFLWREVFLQLYDDPRKAIRPIIHDDDEAFSEPFDWKGALQHRTEAEIVAHHALNAESNKRQRTLKTFVDAVTQALPAPRDSQSRPSLNLQWLDRLLRETQMLTIVQPGWDMVDEHSRLMAYISLTHDSSTDEDSQETLADRRVSSRCFVYDIRNYRQVTHWGPFLPSGSVNWIHIEHLVNVVLTNLRDLPDHWGATTPPLGLEHTQAFTAPGPYSDNDWAGVEGTWRRYVCFMDYRDLFAFNYSNIANGPRNPEFFRDSRFREATRLIEVKLHLVPENQLRFHEPSPDCGQVKTRYPTLYFAGTSRGVTGNEAKVEGSVCIGIDGTVRWTFYDLIQGAVHHSSTLWCSKGVQLGGIASAAGIVGSWSTSAHDQGDPVGPFWLWKVPHAHTGPLMDFT
ncbi:hypothetical protein C8R42DRAFT_675984 [Lentinula raphanica]|nr:hypothetical protein C8R42DRAFT_675984 [Lentinula raphanica]